MARSSRPLWSSARRSVAYGSRPSPITTRWPVRPRRSRPARVWRWPLEAVRLVVAHGGVPSLAPRFRGVGLGELRPLVVAAGLAGIEAYYGSPPPAMTAACLALARRYALVPTGGSDFHGRGDHGAPLGGVFVPPQTIAALEARRPAHPAATMTTAPGGGV